ncbi:MAG: hypothetical protein C5B56_11265 [Proteobacteria bacterium]|nr:MAG: hypothetical protein C5B56_11265 [Pseudomonadota bacterium]
MANPEEKIAQLAPSWIWNIHRCLATDIAINFIAEQVDPATRTQLMAATLETTAAAYRTLAEGASNAAKIVAKGSAKG